MLKTHCFNGYKSRLGTRVEKYCNKTGKKQPWEEK
jgi:hypothetical protein